jgi:hypothetical protein
MVTSFNWDMGLGHPVVTVTAGCASILDQNWRIKNSHLIDGKLVFRLEASLSSGGTSVPVPAGVKDTQLALTASNSPGSTADIDGHAG